MKTSTRWLLFWIVAALSLAGCSKPVLQEPAPRPVRTIEIGSHDAETSVSLAGEVRARYEARVGFRVAGKILRRYVNLGDRLQAGALISELDPVDYRLVADALAAQLSAAQGELEFAVADLQRYRELLDDKLISAAEFDRRKMSTNTSRDRVVTLKSQLDQARNQTQYTRLIAEHNAIVVAVLAETDQVVAIGQPVVILARPEELEIAVDIPEHRRDLFTRARTVGVSFWARPGVHLEGRVREVPASSDPASRTYAARVSLSTRPDWVQLGMSATASIRGESSEGYAIPLSAVFQAQGDVSGPARVWVVNESGAAVTSTPVELGTPTGANEVVVTGLTPGQRIVTAGTSRLREGQAIRVVDPSVLGGPPLHREGAGGIMASRTNSTKSGPQRVATGGTRGESR